MGNARIFFLVLFLLIKVTIIALSQNTGYRHFSHLSAKDGLADNSINVIHQESRGFIWIGTVYGLSRYDAYNFKNFRWDESDSSSLSDNYIKCITDDTIAGNLWIGTSNGLNYYNRNTESFTRYLSSSRHRQAGVVVNALLFSEEQGLILGTSNGLVFFSPDSVISLNKDPDNNNSLCYNEVISLCEDHSNRLWVGTQNGLDIFYANSHTFEHVKLPVSGKKPVYVYDIFEDSRQNIVLCTRYHGLIILESGSPSMVTIYEQSHFGLSGDYIEKAVETTDGFYWLAVRDEGLARFNPYTGEVLTYTSDFLDPCSKSGISSKSITTLTKDIQGNIWIGTYNSGVNILDINKKPFRHYRVNSRNDGLFNNNIRTLFQDSEGRIWIGTKEGGGLSEYKPIGDYFIHYRKDLNNNYGLNDDYVFAIEEYNKDTLLIGTYHGGLNVFSKITGRFTHYMHHPDTPRSDLLNAIYEIYKDRSGRIWVGTLKNLCLFDFRKKSYTLIDSVLDVRNILQDKNGRLWFSSTRSGLLTGFGDEGVFKPISVSLPNGKPVNLTRINHMSEDSKGNIWIATGETGVIRLSADDFTYDIISTEKGLASDQTYAVVEDLMNNIWVSFASGLSRINLSSGRINTYGSYDGLEGNSFERQVCLRLENGELMFGGNAGFTIFQPAAIKENQFIPPVFITDIKIANVSLDYRLKGSPLNRPVTETRSITLKHHQANITFEFAALNYSIPEKNQYKYKLEGFDTEWHHAGNERRAIYTNLDPGRYTFRVAASNNDGVWNETGTSISIRILPPFWNSWLAYIIYLLAIFILANAVYKYFKLKESFRRDILQERLQRRKEEELHELKMKFFTNISHEFRTPLTLITAPLQQMLQMDMVNQSLKETLSIVYRNAFNLLQQINQLMDFRRIETCNLYLRHEKVDVNTLVEESVSPFRLLAQQKGVHFDIQISETKVLATLDTEKIVSVLKNLISNSLKFCKDNDTITLRVNKNITATTGDVDFNVFGHEFTTADDYFEIIVEDTGQGIKKEEIPKIFNRYYRVKSNPGNYQPGTGIGLSVVKSYIESHNGNILVFSAPGKGTRFFLQLPYQQTTTAPWPVENTPDTDGPDLLTEPDLEQEIDGIDFNEEPYTVNETIKLKLLLVDDNADMVNFLVNSLSATYQVFSAFDAGAGYEIATRQRPDLIISDIMMPGIDGIEFCHQLKSTPETCHIPVILLTARTTVESRITGIETGADAYISKPFDLRLLKAQIRNLIGQRKKLKSIFSRKLVVNPGEVTASSLDEQFLNKALQFIEKNMANPELSIEMLASEMAMSRTNLHMKLKAITGQSASEFIRTIRLKRAMQLLSSGGYAIKDVVYMVGFTSPSYFTKCFKAYFNLLPNQCIGKPFSAE